MRTRQLAWRRLTAWLIDWLCILILPAVLVPIGLLVRSAGVDVPGWVLNLGAFLILIVPVTCWLAWCESGQHQATPGKRLRGLKVVDRSGGRATFRRTLLRNAFKIALPWELGHTVAYGFAVSSEGAWLTVLTILTYAVLLAWLWSILLPRTPYDVLSGTLVISAPAR